MNKTRLKFMVIGTVNFANGEIAARTNGHWSFPVIGIGCIIGFALMVYWFPEAR
jgi:hypothetical protein